MPNKEMRYFEIKGKFFKPRNGKIATKTFPSLNNLLSQAEKSPYAYNSDKKRYMGIATSAIRHYLGSWKANGKITLHFEFYEPKDGHYRDFDNISGAAHKIILDAMVKCKVIKDDRPSIVNPSLDEFYYTDGVPKIIVRIEEHNDTERNDS